MLKEYFLKLRTQQVLKHNKAQRFTLNYPDTRKIGLLFLLKNGDGHETLNRFVRRLKSEGKEVEALTLLGDKNINPYKFNYNFITSDQLSPFGKLKSTPALNFIETRFDYLYCITQQDSLVFDYILAASKAKCRVGRFQEGKSDFYELMVNVQPSDGLKKLMETMLHYTKAIVHNQYQPV